MTLRSAALISILLGLLACSPRTTATNAPTSAAPHVPAGGPDTVVSDADLPRLKAGQWAFTTADAGAAAQTRRICKNGESIKPQQLRRGCGTVVFKRTFQGAFVIDAACSADGISSTMTVTISGDFTSTYAAHTTGSLRIPGQGPVTFDTRTEGHYVGPCPTQTGQG